MYNALGMAHGAVLLTLVQLSVTVGAIYNLYNIGARCSVINIGAVEC